MIVNKELQPTTVESYAIFQTGGKQYQAIPGKTLAIEKIEGEAGWRIFPCVTVSRNEYRRAIGDELFRSYAL